MNTQRTTPSPILVAGLKTSEEFRYTVGNVSTDNKLTEGSDAYNQFWNDETSFVELAYVESTFREGGHVNCDERTPGQNLEHARLKKLLAKYRTPELMAAFKRAYPSAR